MWVVTPYFEMLIARDALGQLAGLPSEAGGARAPVSSAGGTAWAGHAGERGGRSELGPPPAGGQPGSLGLQGCSDTKQHYRELLGVKPVGNSSLQG